MDDDLDILRRINTTPRIKIPLSMTMARNWQGMNFSASSTTIKIRFQRPISTHTLGRPNALVLSTIRLDPIYTTNIQNISVQFLLENDSFQLDTSGSRLTYVSKSNNTIVVPSQNNSVIWGLLFNLTTPFYYERAYNVKLQVLMRDCTDVQGKKFFDH